MNDARYPISGHTEIDDLGDAFAPYTYRYKSPALEPRANPDGGRYAGVMAQNLEQHPLGAQIVQDTPQGKQLEAPALMSALAAMAGRHHDRLNDHEGALAQHGALHAEHARRLDAMERALGMMRGAR